MSLQDPLVSNYGDLACPACGAALHRKHRQRLVRQDPQQGALRRYGCSGCSWQGLLPRRVRPASASGTAVLGLGRISRWLKRRPQPWPALAVLALLSGAGMAAAVAWQAGGSSQALRWRTDALYARGEHHGGEPLPGAHPLQRHHARAALHGAVLAAGGADPGGAADGESAAGAALPRSPSIATGAAPVAVADTLALRYGCVWGQPGRDPYRGSVEQALRSAALPEGLVKTIAAQVRAGQPVDRLRIDNHGILAQGSGRVFNAQNIAMTHGRSLCLGTRVNFSEGHSESADLYEAQDAQGRVVAVMVPAVCGNVSVLGQSVDAPLVTPPSNAPPPNDPGASGPGASGLAANSPGANGPGVASPGANGPGAAGQPVRWLPSVLEAPAGSDGRRYASSGKDILDVAEPATLACVLLALAALALQALRRRHP